MLEAHDEIAALPVPHFDGAHRSREHRRLGGVEIVDGRLNVGQRWIGRREPGALRHPLDDGPRHRQKKRHLGLGQIQRDEDSPRRLGGRAHRPSF